MFWPSIRKRKIRHMITTETVQNMNHWNACDITRLSITKRRYFTTKLHLREAIFFQCLDKAVWIKATLCTRQNCVLWMLTQALECVTKYPPIRIKNLAFPNELRVLKLRQTLTSDWIHEVPKKFIYNRSAINHGFVNKVSNQREQL